MSLQRGPIRQHIAQPMVGGLEIEQQKRVYEQVLAEWKDDSDEPFTTEGVEIS